MPLYFLIDHGPKPSGQIERCKAAKQQILNFRHVLNNSEGVDKLPVCHDYSRKHSTLRDLPTLQSVLSRASDSGSVLLIDDFRRIFVKCDHSHRIDLLKELQGYSGHFRDLRTRQDIGQLDQSQTLYILQVESPYKFALAKAPRSARTAQEKREQTRKASSASRIARGEAADRKARSLQELYRNLSSRTEDLSMAALAREANQQGLKTTTGRGWTGASVTRALKRLTPPS